MNPAHRDLSKVTNENNTEMLSVYYCVAIE